MPDGLTQFISPYLLGLILKYKYFILFPILVLEGPVTTIILGALASPDVGEFNLVPLYLFVIFCDVFGDTVYYLIGRFAGEKLIAAFKKWRGIKDNVEIKLHTYFERYGSITLVFGKIGHGIGWPVMVAAGSAQMPYPRFLMINTTVSIFKSAGLIAIGYYFWKDYPYIAAYMSSFSSALSILLIGAGALFLVLNRLQNID